MDGSSEREDLELILLASQLKHSYIRIRKEAVLKAESMLKEGRDFESVLSLLDTVTLMDPVASVSQMAQTVVDRYRPRESSANPDLMVTGAAPNPDPPEEIKTSIFEAVCPAGHVNYFDKRQVCPSKKSYWRRTTEKEGVVFDRLTLRCGKCAQEILIDINCEGYN
jgi:hypothetical protein